MRLLSFVILLAVVALTDNLSAREMGGGRPQERNSNSDRHREELNDRDLYEKNRANLERENALRRQPINVNVNGAGADCGTPGNPCVEQVPVDPSNGSQQ